MKKNLVSVFMLAMFSLPAMAAQPTCDSPVGTWENQLGSTMTIDSVDPNTGAIAGRYRSPSGTSGQEFPLSGWLNRAPYVEGKDNAVIISFSVRWGSIGSVTSWSGVCKEQNRTPAIQALWHLARPNTSFVWDHVLTGNDVFSPKSGSN